MADERTRIIIADDEASNRNLIGEIINGKRGLYPLRYQVESVDNGEELVKRVTANYPLYRFVVTDNRMPGLSGFDAVMELRKRGVDTPVVMVSGTINDVLGKFDFEQLGGMDEGYATESISKFILIPKPFPRAELEKAINFVTRETAIRHL